jgi:hypothetical protein
VSLGKVRFRTMARRKSKISERADVVRIPGKHIGFFELVVWSWLRRVRVLMLYGRNIVDVRAWFGVALPEQVLVGTHRVAAVRVTTKGNWLSAPEVGSGIINHFVIGCAAVDRMVVEAPAAGRSLVVTTARRAAMSVGWTLKKTVAQGDCGPDSLAYHDDATNRSPEAWLGVREELARFMDTVQNQVVWQQVFRACGEADPQPVLRAVPRSVGGMAPPVGSGGLGTKRPPLPPPTLPPPLGSGGLGPADSPCRHRPCHHRSCHLRLCRRRSLLHLPRGVCR